MFSRERSDRQDANHCRRKPSYPQYGNHNKSVNNSYNTSNHRGSRQDFEGRNNRHLSSASHDTESSRYPGRSHGTSSPRDSWSHHSDAHEERYPQGRSSRDRHRRDYDHRQDDVRYPRHYEERRYAAAHSPSRYSNESDRRHTPVQALLPTPYPFPNAQPIFMPGPTTMPSHQGMYFGPPVIRPGMYPLPVMGSGVYGQPYPGGQWLFSSPPGESHRENISGRGRTLLGLPPESGRGPILYGGRTAEYDESKNSSPRSTGSPLDHADSSRQNGWQSRCDTPTSSQADVRSLSSPNPTELYVSSRSTSSPSRHSLLATPEPSVENSITGSCYGNVSPAKSLLSSSSCRTPEVVNGALYSNGTILGFRPEGITKITTPRRRNQDDDDDGSFFERFGARSLSRSTDQTSSHRSDRISPSNETGKADKSTENITADRTSRNHHSKPQPTSDSTKRTLQSSRQRPSRERSASPQTKAGTSSRPLKETASRQRNSAESDKHGEKDPDANSRSTDHGKQTRTENRTDIESQSNSTKPEKSFHNLLKGSTKTRKNKKKSKRRNVTSDSSASRNKSTSPDILEKNSGRDTLQRPDKAIFCANQTRNRPVSPEISDETANNDLSHDERIDYTAGREILRSSEPKETAPKENGTKASEQHSRFGLGKNEKSKPDRLKANAIFFPRSDKGKKPANCTDRLNAEKNGQKKSLILKIPKKTGDVHKDKNHVSLSKAHKALTSEMSTLRAKSTQKAGELSDNESRSDSSAVATTLCTSAKEPSQISGAPSEQNSVSGLAKSGVTDDSTKETREKNCPVNSSAQDRCSTSLRLSSDTTDSGTEVSQKTDQSKLKSASVTRRINGVSKAAGEFSGQANHSACATMPGNESPKKSPLLVSPEKMQDESADDSLLNKPLTPEELELCHLTNMVFRDVERMARRAHRHRRGTLNLKNVLQTTAIPVFPAPDASEVSSDNPSSSLENARKKKRKVGNLDDTVSTEKSASEPPVAAEIKDIPLQISARHLTAADITEYEIMVKKKHRQECLVPNYGLSEPKRLKAICPPKVQADLAKYMEGMLKPSEKKKCLGSGKITPGDLVSYLKTGFSPSEKSLEQLLFHAVKSHSKKENFIGIVMLLLANGVNCDAVDDNGDTALKLAVLAGDYPMVDLLVQHSLAPALDARKNNKCHIAAAAWIAQMCAWDIVLLVLENSSVEQLFVKNLDDKISLTMLVSQPEFQFAHIEDLILAMGAENLAQYSAESFLHLVAAHRRVDLVHFCLARFPFDPVVADKSGRTVLHLFAAFANLNKKDMEQLADMAQNLGVPLDVADQKNMTEMQIAENSGNISLAGHWQLAKEGKFILEPFCLFLDISYGMESFPIKVINERSADSMNGFTYIRENIYLGENPTSKGTMHCPCPPGKCDAFNCPCLKRGLAYSATGTVVPGSCKGNPIFECGPMCPCGPNCASRVVQNGIRMPFEIFMTRNRGWGVRATRTIQPGEFVVEFVGEIVESDMLLARDPDNDWAMELTVDTYDGVMYHVDPTHCGNVARFLNHSCDPNLFAARVYVSGDPTDTGVRMAMFSAQVIHKGKELTFDYGDEYWRRQNERGVYCQCGSLKKCKFMKRGKKSRKYKNNNKAVIEDVDLDDLSCCPSEPSSSGCQ
ncbi:uncharacterized protein LOC129593563 [Paramacrobiotus metropolitanus]|uniref:uncharacterized protein LOC129593563 n=1 Tax=Paramacrobiotus metropolitanus TaxID=2943436 RepID=UPI00244562BD|nr:uncharacterized protein LOC129593563 [Paramacrobiotus metropolitanus]